MKTLTAIPIWIRFDFTVSEVHFDHIWCPQIVTDYIKRVHFLPSVYVLRPVMAFESAVTCTYSRARVALERLSELKWRIIEPYEFEQDLTFTIPLA